MGLGPSASWQICRERSCAVPFGRVAEGVKPLPYQSRSMRAMAVGVNTARFAPSIMTPTVQSKPPPYKENILKITVPLPIDRYLCHIFLVVKAWQAGYNQEKNSQGE